MAWISVHEGVDGPKLRDLYKKLDCSKFEALGILNFLWFWGLTNADKDGHIKNVDREDIERMFHGAGSGCKIAPDKILDGLIETGWLDLIPNGMYIHDWDVWQEQWYKAKERRQNDAQRKRESRAKIAQARALPIASDEMPEENSENDIDNNTLAEPVSVSNVEGKYMPGFENFWSVYPRKVGKGDAYKKYNARRNDGYSDDELIAAAKVYASQCIKQKTEKQYIKHPKTFLSDTLPFLDYLPKREEPEVIPTDPDSNPFEQWRNG